MFNRCVWKTLPHKHTKDNMHPKKKEEQDPEEMLQPPSIILMLLSSISKVFARMCPKPWAQEKRMQIQSCSRPFTYMGIKGF